MVKTSAAGAKIRHIDQKYKEVTTLPVGARYLPEYKEVTTLHDRWVMCIPTFFKSGLDGGCSRKWSC